MQRTTIVDFFVYDEQDREHSLRASCEISPAYDGGPERLDPPEDASADVERVWIEESGGWTAVKDWDAFIAPYNEEQTKDGILRCRIEDIEEAALEQASEERED